MIFKKIFFLLNIPFVFLYFIIIALRNIFYNVNIFRKHKINAKVISVGNITWGGQEKLLWQHLLQACWPRKTIE